MKRNSLLLIGLLITSAILSAQTQFENARFEAWEDIQYGSVQEPVDWSSIRSAEPDDLAQLAPAVWGPSDDAHSGNHSLYLKNIATFGIVATGTLTNGRILANLDPTKGNSHTDPENPQWNTPLPHRPDSVTGWYKCNPSTGDFPTAKVLLHTGYAALPQDDSSTWIGVAYIELSSTPVTTWTRFSVPFTYFNDQVPEYELTILTAGNGTNAVANSEAWFDDLEFIYNDGTSIREYNNEDLVISTEYNGLNIYINSRESKRSQVMISDISGRQVYTGEILTGQPNHLDLNVEDGIYIVSTRVGDQLLAKKVFLN